MPVDNLKEAMGEETQSITVTTSIDLWSLIDDLRGDIESNLECADYFHEVIAALIDMEIDRSKENG